MSRKKVNINRPEISKEEISAKKNFSHVLNGFQKVYKPFYKKPWFLNSLIAVAVTAGITAAVMKHNSTTKSVTTTVDSTKTIKTITRVTTTVIKTDSIVTHPFVNEPIKAASIPYSKYRVKANEKSEIKHSTGTKIRIPKNAFVDAEGKAVKGEVEIDYREFQDIEDIFLSGIPMTYDSAGQQYVFESAGMFDIKGFQNDKPLFIAPGKTLQVEMKSADDREKFNSYVLDTVQKNWVCLGKDKIKKEVKVDSAKVGGIIESGDLSSSEGNIKKEFAPKIEKVQAELTVIKKDIAVIETTKPVEPQKVDSKKYHFNLDVNAKEYPELAVYKDVQFEVNDNTFEAKYYKITWDEANLSKGKEKLTYKLTLVKDKEKHVFNVQPTLDGKNYEAARADFNSKFDQYSTALTKRKADEAQKQKQLDSLNAEISNSMDKYVAASNQSFEVFRMFTLKNFGVYNSDCPHRFPKEANVIARFVDKDGKAVLNDYADLYLAERGKNMVYIYHSANMECREFRFNPKARNIIWAVNYKGDLVMLKLEPGTYTYEDHKEFILKMVQVDKAVRSKADLKKIFET